MEYFDKVDLLSKDPPIARKKVVKSTTNTTMTGTNTTMTGTNHYNQAASNNNNNIQASNNNNNIQKASVPPVHDNTPSVPPRKQSLQPNQAEWNIMPITSIEVMSISQDHNNQESFCIKVCRGKQYATIINRSIPDFITLAAAAGEVFKKINAENYPLSIPTREGKIKSLEVYLNRLILILIPSLHDSTGVFSITKASEAFFNPRDVGDYNAGQNILRRDSGADTEYDPSKNASNKDISSNISAPTPAHSGQGRKTSIQGKHNPFSSFSKMVFGHSN